MTKCLKILIRIFRTLEIYSSDIINKITFKLRSVQTGENLSLIGRVHIFGTGKVRIGNNVTICSSLRFNPITGGGLSSLTTTENGEIHIGNNVQMSFVNIFSAQSILIEDNAMLGSGVKIWDTDFHSIIYADRVSNDVSVKSLPVVICKGAFVGANSIILKGVTIGEYAVIGAGSVVTKDVPSNQIWAENPARLIKNIN